MSLITVANLQSLTDKLAYIYGQLKTQMGVHGGSAVATTHRFIADAALNVVVADIDDYQQQTDLATALYTLTTKTNRKEWARSFLQASVAAINDHITSRGSSVASSIVDLAAYMSYYNGGSGDVAYSSMLHPVFGDLWYDLYATRLPDEGLFHPGIHPWLDSTYTNGMGIRAVGGSLTDGADYESTPLYAEVQPLLEITTTFANGAAVPTFTIAGTDNTGASLNWTVSGATNNPVAAVSTTITPAITAPNTRQTCAVASASGIIVGSVLKINAGLVDEEVVIVESVSSNDLIFVPKKAHTAGAALTGNRTLLLVPGTAGRRMRTLTNITIGVTSHDAGAVRVIGKQDRDYNPD